MDGLEIYILLRRVTDLICAYVKKLIKLVLKCNFEVDLFK